MGLETRPHMDSGFSRMMAVSKDLSHERHLLVFSTDIPSEKSLVLPDRCSLPPIAYYLWQSFLIHAQLKEK
jgi:hypothetical protein